VGLKIGTELIKEMENRIATYPNPRKMSIDPVLILILISVSGVTQNEPNADFFREL